MGEFQQLPDLGLLRQAVPEELERICTSDPFKHSRQSVRLLRYLVEHSLAGDEDSLRERAIGASLFGRDPKYDTNEDSIVRVSAAEVRKRLTRYYQETGAPAGLQFAIPTGSYRVEFHALGPAPADERPASRKWTVWVLGLGALGILAAILAVNWPRSAMARFWGPALSDDSGVVILAPHPVVYTLSRDTFLRFRGQTASHAQRQIEVLTGPPDAAIQLREVVPIKDQYIGLGSAHAISSVAALLAVEKKRYTIRFGGDFSFQDIRHAPAVLVGAYANRWTLQLTDDYRFVLSDREGAPEILDRRSGKLWRLKDLQPNGKTPEDYTIVSRLFHPKTGKLVIALAGITQYGTQAAGEFVTDPEILGEALRGAPADWERRNAQFLLHVPIVEGVPGRPEVVEKHFW